MGRRTDFVLGAGCLVRRAVLVQVPRAGYPGRSNEMRDLVIPLVELDAIQRARQRIVKAVRVTPLVAASSDERWAHLRLKCENLQAGGAFKLRGAFNFVSQLDPAVTARGVITYSSGNHGQAMALAARRLGAPAVVVMPTTAPAVKVEGARAFGAEVLFAGTTSIDRKLAAEALASERGLTIVPPFDHADIIAGQGTAGLEIAGPATGRDGRLCPRGWRRADFGRRRGGQAAGAVGATRRRRACRGAEDDPVAGGRPADDA